MTTEQKAKSKFRQSSKWKNFRKLMKKKSGGLDYVTGKPLRKGWQLHHLDMDFANYEVLDPERFICINKTTHEMIHWLYRYDNIDELLSKLSEVEHRMNELTYQEK